MAAPNIQAMWNAFYLHNARHPQIVVEANVAFACREVELDVVAVLVKKLLVGQPRQVVYRVVVVCIVVVVSAQELTDVECAAHAQAMIHELRVFECKVQSVVSAEAATRDGDAAGRVPELYKAQHFSEQVVFVLHVAQHALRRRNVAVVPALSVNTIETKKLKSASFDGLGKRRDHFAVFEFEESAHGCWEHQYRLASLAKDQKFHFPAQRRAPPLVIFAIHAPVSVTGLASGSIQR